jgi:hypothetical protein
MCRASALSASSRGCRELANAHLSRPFLADRTRSPSPRVLARFANRDAGRRWPAGRMREKVHDKVHDKVCGGG